MTEGVREFWYGSAERWSAAILPRVMLSFNAIRRLRKPWALPLRIMEDSGAYVVILKHGRYPWTPQEYAENLWMWHPEVAWTMDYPCEPTVRRAGGYTVAEAQVKTNANTRNLLDIGANVQSVVQGWEISDYLDNLDLLNSEGLLTVRLGIGSICRRGQTEEIVRIVRAIHANVPGWVKLHGFGVKTGILQSEARFFLHSVDSSAWRFRVFGHFDGMDGKTVAEKVPVVRRYVERHEAMLNPTEPLALEGNRTEGAP
jgi:hypothetical protein